MLEKLKEKNFISAVVYVRDHEKWISQFVHGLIDTLDENFEHFEVIFVNDDSMDQSVEIIKRIAKECEDIQITIINLSYRQGVEAAMNAGVDIAIGDFVLEFDSPYFDYDYSEIMRVYTQCINGYDVVSASPDVKELLSSKIFYLLFRRYSRNQIQLSTERFCILSRRGINRINMLNKVIPYRKAIYFNSGLKTINLKYPVKSTDGKKKSNVNSNALDRMDLAINSLLLFTDVGVRVAIYMAALMSLLAVITLVYTVVVYYTYSRVIEGWTTIMLFLSTSFCGLFILLAILIKYVSMILYVQHHQHTYVIETIEKT